MQRITQLLSRPKSVTTAAVASSEGGPNTGRKVVACIGSSSTAGKGQAFNWIGELQGRPQNRDVRFANFGVGGDLAYNALQRLDDAVACRPDKVVIWVGTNDVLARVSPNAGRFFRLTKHLPIEPSADWFCVNIEALARRLKSENMADIAFCSLPPIGEDPASDAPFQTEVNRLITVYSAIIKAVTLKEGVGYIPLHEAMLAQIQASPPRPFTSFRFLPMYRDAFRTLVLGKSPDEVAQMNGWRFHTDGVHLNSRGGMIAADLIQQFIDGFRSLGS